MARSKIEDFKVIDNKNRIGNYQQYIAHDSPYPIMYVNKQPVWENDEVLFVAHDGKLCIRQINSQQKTLIAKNPNAANAYFFDIRKANHDNLLTPNNTEIIKKFV